MGTLPLAQRAVGVANLDVSEGSPGRRLRTFSLCIAGDTRAVKVRGTQGPFLRSRRPLTYGEAYNAVTRCGRLEGERQLLSSLPLRINAALSTSVITYTEIPERYEKGTRDADLHPALQDLATEIMSDTVEACAALDDPGVWYPGVDDGIEPVSDEHVRLVMWAMQRELNRELRGKPGDTSGHVLPGVPLGDLPWRVQRALAERRRLRYQEFGIGRKQWEQNAWSLWDVPEDRDWLPRRDR